MMSLRDNWSARLVQSCVRPGDMQDVTATYAKSLHLGCSVWLGTIDLDIEAVNSHCSISKA